MPSDGAPTLSSSDLETASSTAVRVATDSAICTVVVSPSILTLTSASVVPDLCCRPQHPPGAASPVETPQPGTDAAASSSSRCWPWHSATARTHSRHWSHVRSIHAYSGGGGGGAPVIAVSIVTACIAASHIGGYTETHSIGA
eukprot:scaffold44978_cov58-Phaeocystis_antarctica.AAC.2